jgi:hypothetical protein
MKSTLNLAFEESKKMQFHAKIILLTCAKNPHYRDCTLWNFMVLFPVSVSPHGAHGFAFHENENVSGPASTCGIWREIFIEACGLGNKCVHIFNRYTHPAIVVLVYSENYVL